MSSIIDSLNRPWQVMNLATGEQVTVAACSARSAIINHVVDSEAYDYLDRNPIFEGERTVTAGDWCALVTSPYLEDIFNA